MQCLSKLFLVLAQSLIRTFSKSLYLKRSTKGAINSSFRRAPCTQPSINKNLTEMQCLSKLLQVQQNLSLRLSQSTYFKPLFERSNDQLLSQSTLFTAFYQQKASKTEMLKQFGVSTNEIYQEAFFRVPVLNRSTKGATISSFRRAPCSQPSISKERAKMKYLSNLK